MATLTPEQEIDEILDTINEDMYELYNDSMSGNPDTSETISTAKRLLLALKKKWEDEARIDELKTVASVHCGIPTKTVKRSDLKDWIVYKINQLTNGDK